MDNSLNHLVSDNHKILLASNSPRRREIMDLLKIPFTVVTLSGIDESYPPYLETDKVSEYIANKKADEFLKIINDNELIITADTVVCDNGIVLGKPKDKAEAKQMLLQLSGHAHEVITGVSIVTQEKTVQFASTSKVFFSALTDKEIDYYINVYQPFDKAGAYGIQEWIGFVGVTRIEGSYFNVMGLPIQRLYTELKQF